MLKERKYHPDFNQLLTVLRKEKPTRPVLFEFFLNEALYALLSGEELKTAAGKEDKVIQMIHAFHNAGYDYVTLPAWMYPSMQFDLFEHDKKMSYSLNDGYLISDEKSFNAFPWPDPDKADYRFIERCASELPAGMLFIPSGPGGVLENVISLVGFDRLCYMLYENEPLARAVFDEVGIRMMKFYELISLLPCVGALLVNDDWGFKTQTMLDPASLREYVFPWHKRITAAIHASGKPAILHCCGNLNEVMDEIIDDLQYDGKHSFEDEIQPVEIAYELYSKRIALLGGIDLDFLVRSTPEKIRRRTENLIRLTQFKSYALGSGNSIPAYVPVENYLAMNQIINIHQT